MRVSLKWLRELVDVSLTTDELVDRLDMTGTAVEAVERIGEGLEGVVIGRVLTREPHPDAEKLSLSLVDVGEAEPLSIVCGAPDYSVGDIVPVALVGTNLPNGMTLKRAKIRGQLSEGMMCAADELGLGDDHTGLLVLPGDAPVGEPFAQWRGMADTVLELEVTPNRPDCLSVAGVAREVAAVTGTTARRPEYVAPPGGADTDARVSLTLDDPALCSRYTARVIEGVRIGPSPAWLAERVNAAGARSINNVVDVTNLVMFELGQPLHAFDLDKLGSRDGRVAITVRLAGAGEDLVTLDGQDRQLSPDTLLICDPSGPVALAGVMGGLDTEVSEATTSILLESACFQAASIGRTSRRLGLQSEASQRFERGVDPNGCADACDRAAALIAEVSGGTVLPGIADAYPVPVEPLGLTLRIARMNALLGTSLTGGDAVDILRRLGLEADEAGDGTLAVTVPTFRPDLVREVDLIEEVVRVHGMERVDPTLPAGRGRVGGLTVDQRRRDRAGVALRAAGLCEALTWDFGDPRDLERLRWDLAAEERLVRLLNPMTEDQCIMRVTTLPGLIGAVAANQRKGVTDVQLYEIGTVWRTADGRKLPREREVVSAVLAGRWSPVSWWESEPERERVLDFSDIKGVLETLMEDLGVTRWAVRAAERPWLQPGRSAEVTIGGELAGWMGEVHPEVLDAFEAAGPVSVFEIDLAPLLRAAREVGDVTDLPRMPAVKADIAIVVDESVTAERVAQALASAGGRMLESVRLFDVYRGPGVAEGRKSLAFALAYRDAERTLTDAEVADAHAKLVRKATSAVGGELRS